ncbi:MAG: redox-regulated ATPase YchF [Candidatus Micrarchaeota archaeon]|nr:redox-regulated ATPase YchF [Candidatus Micrarchaeota archaeon]
MMVGIVGGPNKGKSTLFSALTMIDVPIADYPFTTINPNMGVGYVTTKCAEVSLGVKCNARNSRCANGVRMVPINLVDVAGLVEGAHEGKGMGNQFLNDLASADALMVVVDASGKTDPNGNPCGSCNPADDYRIVMDEIASWVASIITRNSDKIRRSKDAAEAVASALSFLHATKSDVESCITKEGLPFSPQSWDATQAKRFAASVFGLLKPIMIVANKVDAAKPGWRDSLAPAAGGRPVVGCSAAIELALRKAAKKGLIEYATGERSFKVAKPATQEEEKALAYMAGAIKSDGTNVQEALNSAVFRLLEMIVVYPVEDESKFTDHQGNVLPDAILIRRGSTALDLAAKIHTDIAKGMLYAVDARTKMRLAKDYVLKDNDVIRIVTAVR